jgi:DNA-binding MarR family transcriptional regulator
MKDEDNTFIFDNANDSTGFLLWQLTNLWQREIKRVLAKYDLTHSQFVLLASVHWLTLHNKIVTQISLSSHTKIDPMTTSTVLRTLQKKGLLKRGEHSIDTRAKTVELTKKGIGIIKNAVQIVEEFDASFFKSLGKKIEDFNNKILLLLSYKEENN